MVSYPDAGFLSGCVVARGLAAGGIGGPAADWWPVVMAARQWVGGSSVGGALVGCVAGLGVASVWGYPDRLCASG